MRLSLTRPIWRVGPVLSLSLIRRLDRLHRARLCSSFQLSLLGTIFARGLDNCAPRFHGCILFLVSSDSGSLVVTVERIPRSDFAQKCGEGITAEEESQSIVEIFWNKRSHRTGCRIHNSIDSDMVLFEIRNNGCLQRTVTSCFEHHNRPVGYR